MSTWIRSAADERVHAEAVNAPGSPNSGQVDALGWHHAHVDVLACGHIAHPSDKRACRHLLVEEPGGFVLVLSGVGMHYDLLCDVCDKSANRRAALLRVCEGCIDRALDLTCFIGWRGSPEVRHWDTIVRGTSTTHNVAITPRSERCLAALPHGWLAVAADGLHEIGTTGVARRWADVRVVDELSVSPDGHDKSEPALHTSPDGRFAAIVNDYGQFGVVVDLSTGSPTIDLDRGSSHNWTTPFPFAFVSRNGRTVAIAATAWNRLDAFDAATGECLTPRAIPAPQAGASAPEHYLDYFHGRLTPSPTGRWLLVDGWVWHPVGVPRVVDVEAWLHGDIYAAEHGKNLDFRDYAWNQPVAWTGEHIVAIQRIGHDDEAMIEGVQLYDVRGGARVGMFAGPAGPMWGHKGLLYVRAAPGLEVWDPGLEARRGVVEGFRPTAQSRSGSFAEITAGRLRVWIPDVDAGDAPATTGEDAGATST